MLKIAFEREFSLNSLTSTYIHCEKAHLHLKIFREIKDFNFFPFLGILKPEPIFGGNLMEILSKEPKNDVPEFVKKCTEIIEREKNIKSVGLYRIPGQVSRIQKIRIEINNSNWAVLEGSKIEAHDLTGMVFYSVEILEFLPS